MTITTFTIDFIDCGIDCKYIEKTLREQGYAMVSAITLIPYLKNNTVYQRAYVKVASWADTEVAYNFIQRLKNPSIEARIVHHDDDWWVATENKHNDGDIIVGSYTVHFNTQYDFTVYTDEEREKWAKQIDEDYYYDEEAEEERRIQLGADRYQCSDWENMPNW